MLILIIPILQHQSILFKFLKVGSLIIPHFISIWEYHHWLPLWFDPFPIDLWLLHNKISIHQFLYFYLPLTLMLHHHPHNPNLCKRIPICLQFVFHWHFLPMVHIQLDTLSTVLCGKTPAQLLSTRKKEYMGVETCIKTGCGTRGLYIVINTHKMIFIGPLL